MVIVGLIVLSASLFLAIVAYASCMQISAMGDHTECLPGFAPVDQPSPSRSASAGSCPDSFSDG
ncbi:hypothetical protein BG454_18210 [Roseinatronobacter bogoriensis subsp. barguzinensis]|uniref:Transmembrane protein n=1 Tax=Roseinatronobacter bogoriensis subsp. barguzinensis TaxID=441209 RepID=A0A2K8KKB7_9RHOB|nr:hypothetical protein BG454_18210 [Rhodobaca barguzinensis]